MVAISQIVSLPRYLCSSRATTSWFYGGGGGGGGGGEKNIHKASLVQLSFNCKVINTTCTYMYTAYMCKETQAPDDTFHLLYSMKFYVSENPQIEVLQSMHDTLKDQKHKLFQQLKTVLHEEDERKRQKEVDQKQQYVTYVMAFLQSNLWLVRIYFITRFTVDNNQGRCSLNSA